jgi:hypothetical protein
VKVHTEMIDGDLVIDPLPVALVTLDTAHQPSKPYGTLPSLDRADWFHPAIFNVLALAVEYKGRPADSPFVPAQYPINDIIKEIEDKFNIHKEMVTKVYDRLKPMGKLLVEQRFGARGKVLPNPDAHDAMPIPEEALL